MSETSDDAKSRTRHDFFYFLVATRYFVNYNKFLKNLIAKEVLEPLKMWKTELESLKLESIEDESLNELIQKYKVNEYTLEFLRTKTFAHIIVVFSAMCLESLINDYCVLSKSSTYFKKYIDKLDTVSKWLVVPKLVTNKEISTDSKAFQSIRELFSLRNSMVHPKTKELDTNKIWIEENIEFMNKKVPLAYGSIKLATMELYKIDPNFKYLDDYKWLWDKKGKFNNLSDLYSFYSSNWGLT